MFYTNRYKGWYIHCFHGTTDLDVRFAIQDPATFQITEVSSRKQAMRQITLRIKK